MGRDPYLRRAWVYDMAVGRWLDILHHKGLQLCPPDPGARVLDVGCGTGLLLERYAAAGCEVDGVDLSPRMLERAQERLGDHGRLHLGDAARLPFAEQSFDLVMACMALHEVKPDVRDSILGEMARVVSADGQVLVIDYHPGPYGFPRGWLVKALNEVIELAAGFEHFVGYRTFLAKGGIPAMAPAHGLVEEQRDVLGEGNIGLYRMRRCRP